MCLRVRDVRYHVFKKTIHNLRVCLCLFLCALLCRSLDYLFLVAGTGNTVKVLLPNTSDHTATVLALFKHLHALETVKGVADVRTTCPTEMLLLRAVATEIAELPAELANTYGYTGEVHLASDSRGTDVVPIGVVRGKLRVSLGLHKIVPLGKLHLARLLEVLGIGLNELGRSDVAHGRGGVSFFDFSLFFEDQACIRSTVICNPYNLTEVSLGFSVRQLGHIDSVGPVWQREFDGGIVELLDVWASAFVIFNFLHSDDLDGVSTCTMAGSHITVALSDSCRDSQITVLAVHVVSSRAGVITKPDTEVLDLQWGLLMNLLDADNFTSCFLEFTQLTQEIPETGLCNNVVWSKDPHAVQRRIGVLLGRQFASDDFEFLKLQKGEKINIS